MDVADIVSRYNLSQSCGDAMLKLARNVVIRHNGNFNDIPRSFDYVVRKLDNVSRIVMPFISDTINFDDCGILKGLPPINIE